MASQWILPNTFTPFTARNTLSEGIHVNADNQHQTQVLWEFLDAENSGILRKGEFKINMSVWKLLQECGFDEDNDGFISHQDFIDNLVYRASQYSFASVPEHSVHEIFCIFQNNLNIAFSDLLNQLHAKLLSLGVEI
jgi:hypothetical protein